MSFIKRALIGTDGFTLVEIILTVAVIAILAAISTPALIGFLRQRDIREEISMQLEIRTAMEAMINDVGELPSDTATGADAWYNRLAQYTSLSPYRIQFDQWSQPRVYVMLSNTQTMLNTSVDIYYVTLHSKGPNTQAAQITDGAGTVIVPVNGTNFQTNLANTGWWKNKTPAGTANITAFGNVGVPVGSDDIMLRYTDYANKIAQYNKTLDRMSRVTDALESYSRSRYAERVVYCASYTDGQASPADHVAGNPATALNCVDYPPEKQVHYPASNPDNSTPTTIPTGLYNKTVLDATQTQNGNTVTTIYNGGGNATNNTSRRTAMINLMRLLGLPDEYCCSALERFTNGTAIEEMPFYYFSNPRPRATSTTCGTRPALDDSKLPARLTNTYNADGAAGSTCG